ncbi:MAG: S-adenosylmethionine:tRNA ribosyltransferase-isomerase, partial [Bacteroidaceae bacterium]|nr:S-adenosylmethionine:tRNA ribosyltransferase-isomerase [Bacteroidaceae bacterium]
MDTKHIQIRDYDYALPEDRIAKFPLPERDASKLLIYDKGQISETKFRSLPSLLPEGSLMVFNNTRVIQARLHFRKKTPSNSPVKGEDSGDVTAKEALPLREGLGGSEGSGALIEVFLLEPACPVEYQENFASKGSCTWYCLVGNSKKWKEGKLTRTLTIDHSTLTITAERIGTHGTSQEIRFEWRMDPPLPSLKGREKVSPLRGDLEGSLTFAEIIDAVGEL